MQPNGATKNYSMWKGGTRGGRDKSRGTRGEEIRPGQEGQGEGETRGGGQRQEGQGEGETIKGRKDKVREVTCLFAITSKIDISNSVNWYSIYCVYVPQLAARGLPKRRNHGRNMRQVITPSVNYSRHIATGWNIAGLALQILFTNFLAIIQKNHIQI